MIKEGTFIQDILSSNEDHLLNEVPIESTPKETEIIETSTLSSDKMIYEPYVRSVSEAPKDKDSFKKIEAIINAEDHAALIQFDQKLVQKYFKYKKEKLHKQQIQKLLGSKKTI
ncbi:hypothetical protein [Rickettsia endosymbiont of Cantharis rufa]|uniref:hypothetical protein n=1 Tax=Rickettsia endosymbiont of Cantharis rufa TaxID=3066248 RepID=UPI00313337C5